jgi:2-aminoadipate transaminase
MTDFADDFSDEARGAKTSPIRELLKATLNPDIISFGGGFPSPETFPRRRLARVNRILHRKKGRKFFKERLPFLYGLLYSEVDPDFVYQYGPTEGLPQLRGYIARYETATRKRQAARLADDVSSNINPVGEIKPENVIITTGSQQGLYLLMKLLLNEGNSVAVSDPTYLGALQAFNERSPKYIAEPIDEDGMNVDSLMKKIDQSEAKPKFIYIVPEFQNPTGYTTSYDRRVKLLREAEKRDIIVASDTPYKQLRFEGEDIPELWTINEALGIGATLIELKSSSKILAPLRLGYWISDPELASKAVVLKQPIDLCTPNMTQALWHEFARRYGMDSAPKRSAMLYRKKKEIMVRMLRELFGDNIDISNPDGGMFLWVTFPNRVDTEALFEYAVKEGVAFIPGRYFSAVGSCRNGARLNYSLPSITEIEEGCKRLGRAYMKYQSRNVTS